MQDDNLIEKIFHLQNESNERDSRLELKLEYLSERMDKTEDLLEKMSEILNSQKHLSSVVDQLAIQIGQCRNSIDDNTRRIAILENASAKKISEIVNKIAWIVIPILIGAFFTFLWKK